MPSENKRPGPARTAARLLLAHAAGVSFARHRPCPPYAAPVRVEHRQCRPPSLRRPRRSAIPGSEKAGPRSTNRDIVVRRISVGRAPWTARLQDQVSASVLSSTGQSLTVC